MSIGEIAAMIAALAFVVLVVYLVLNLNKLMKVIDDLGETVRRVNTTIDVVTRDVDNLSLEIEGLLNKANTLVEDINGKVSKTDPLFTAIGDLGESVSDLNDATRNMASNFVSTNEVGGRRGKRRGNLLQRVLRHATSSNAQPSAAKQSTDQVLLADSIPEEEVIIAPDNQPELTLEDPMSQQPIDAYRIQINKEPSSTAGEVIIKD